MMFTPSFGSVLHDGSCMIMILVAMYVEFETALMCSPQHTSVLKLHIAATAEGGRIVA